MCSSDPLTFTCEINGAVSLRVVLPDGEQSVVSVGSDPDDVVLSDGFEAVELNIAENPDDSSRNFTLTLSVARASLLDGSEIKCDDTTDDNVDMAGCPILGKLCNTICYVLPGGVVNKGLIYVLEESGSCLAK